MTSPHTHRSATHHPPFTGRTVPPTGRRRRIAGVILTFAVIIAMSALAPSRAAQAATTFNYITAGAGPSDNRLWLAPKTYTDPTTASFYGPVGLSGTTTPGWAFSQWNIPTEIPATTYTPGPPNPTGTWQAGNDYEAVSSTPLGNNEYRMALYSNGVKANLPCVAGTGEMDAFLSPVGSAYQNYQQNFRPLSQSPGIQYLTTLTASMNVQVPQQTIGPARCAPPGGQSDDLAAQVIGIPLKDTAVTPHQVFFYQVVLGYSSPAYFNACATQGQQYEFGDHDTTSDHNAGYGWDDAITLFAGQTCLTAGGASHAYTINLAPRLRSLISSGVLTTDPDPNYPNQTFDTNPADWRVSGFYLGQTINGNATSYSLWDSINLTGS